MMHGMMAMRASSSSSSMVARQPAGGPWPLTDAAAPLSDLIPSCNSFAELNNLLLESSQIDVQ